MECPFELPVRKLVQSKKLGIFRIRAANQKAVAEILTSDEADYIVQAINSHELHKKLVSMLEQYQAEQFWNDNPEKAIEIMCEALKETE